MPTYLKLPNNEEAVEFINLKELASLCGKSKEAFKKLMRRNLFPECNFRKPSKRRYKSGEKVKGDRLYSKNFLAPKIAEIMSEVDRGKKITLEQQTKLLIIFREEREHFNV